MKILFLDDDSRRATTFLNQHPGAKWVQHASDCCEALMSESWDEVHLDHDLDGRVYVNSDEPNTGMAVVRFITSAPREHLKNTLFVVHTLNHMGAERMLQSLNAFGYKVVYRPFGSSFDPDRETFVQGILNSGDFFIPGAIILDVPDEE